MKKIILSAIAIMTIGLANAQETKFGVKAGLNLATLSGGSDLAMRPSFYVGGLVEIKVNEKFSVQPEVVYSSQGTKYKGDSDFSTQLDYINIPVMAKFLVAKGFSIEAGPQIGFLVSAKDTYKGNSVDIKESLSTTDFSLGFGAGYDVTENINIGLRYNVGLTKVNKNSSPGSSDIKNSVFQIGAAYKF